MSKLRWDDLRILVALGRKGTMVAAAEALGMDHATVGRRLSALEHGLGNLLVERTPRGIKLTDAGHRAYAHALRMEDEILSLAEEGAAGSGTVRISSPEAFGHAVISAHVSDFLNAHPEIEIQLVPQGRQANLVNREADISITLSRPVQQRLIARRLAGFGLGLYASPGYLGRFGNPQTVAQLEGHRFVSYIEELLEMPQLSMLAELGHARTVSFRSTSTISQTEAIANGAGIGLLHIFSAEKDPRLARLLPDFCGRRHYWMSFREDIGNLPHVKKTRAWIIETARKTLE